MKSETSSKKIKEETGLKRGKIMILVSAMILFSIITSLSFVSAACTTWLGTTSTNWSIATNWDNGVPDSTLCVILNGTASNQPTLSDPALISNLTINGTLTHKKCSLHTLCVLAHRKQKHFLGDQEPHATEFIPWFLTLSMNWNSSLNVTENVVILNGGTLTHGDNSNAETWMVNVIVGE